MTTTQTLLAEISTARQKLMTVCQSLPVTALEIPRLSNAWSVKDVLAHLAAWEEWATRSLALAVQDDSPLLESIDVDAINETIYQERLDWSWAEVEVAFDAAHKDLVEVIAKLEPTRLKSEAVRQAIWENTVEHYAEHLPDLQRWQRRWQERRG
jgi:uncharacterized damage-inducible protein DinB